LAELVFIWDPQLAVHFLKEPGAERAWFLEGTLMVMEKSKKTVTEWAEYFHAAQVTFDPDHLSGADVLDIKKCLKFIEQAQDFATPVKAVNVKSEAALVYDSSPSPLILNEMDTSFGDSWREELGLPEKVIEHLIDLCEAISRTNEGLRKAQLRETFHYQDITGDFERVKAWQDQVTEKIGKSIPVKDHDFPSLWNALDYGVKAAEAELQEAVKELK
jgi:hypothetical protein